MAFENVAPVIGEMVIFGAMSLSITFTVERSIPLLVKAYKQLQFQSEPLIIEGEKTKDMNFPRCDCTLHCSVCLRHFPAEPGDVQSYRTYCYNCAQSRRHNKL